MKNIILKILARNHIHRFSVGVMNCVSNANIQNICIKL